MSISDDIAKVLEMRPLLKIGVVTRDEIEQVCTIAPRLAAWAQRVMPLVEAAEAYQQRRNDNSPYSVFAEARDNLMKEVIALNLEVPNE